MRSLRLVNLLCPQALRKPVSIPTSISSRTTARGLTTLRRVTPPLPTPTPSASAIQLCRRHFHPTRRRQDVFFFALPALKSTLLNITRFSLLFLPFVFRYRLWKKYKRTTYLLIQLPIFAICIVFALGLDQSPRTGRWRLLLMSEGEELGWSRRKHADALKSDGPVLLPPTDPRSQKVTKIMTRLVTALEEQDHFVVSGASWPPRSKNDLGRMMSESEASEGRDLEARYKPSGVAHSTFMPFRPETSNPLKKLESADWNLYVIDLPQLNAFALPSKDVFVYTGLLDLLPEDDAMLAAVLAHEIAHVVERHSVENLGFLNVATVAFDVLRGISFALTISFPLVTDSAGVFLNWLNDVVATRGYTRKLEEEADAVGLNLMATAGYDPRAAQDLWELMSAVEADNAAKGQGSGLENRFAMLRTHPTSQERYAALERDMESALGIWKEHMARYWKSVELQRAKAKREQRAREEEMKRTEAGEDAGTGAGANAGGEEVVVV